MEQLIWAETMSYSWADTDGAREIGTFAAGGSDFGSLVDSEVATVDDAVTWGDWDPASSTEGQALYDRRTTLADALTDPSAADPSGFVEVRLRVEASECSEWSLVLVNPSTGAILVAHKYPGC